MQSTMDVSVAVGDWFDALTKLGAFPTDVSEMDLDFSWFEGEKKGYIRQVANGLIALETLRAALRPEQVYPTEMFADKDLHHLSSKIFFSAKVWNDEFAQTPYVINEDEWAFWVQNLGFTHALYRTHSYLSPVQVVQVATDLALGSRVASSPDEIEKACRQLVAGGSSVAGKTISLVPARSNELAEAVEQSQRHLYLSCLLYMVQQYKELSYWVPVLSELLTRESLLSASPLGWRGRPIASNSVSAPR